MSGKLSSDIKRSGEKSEDPTLEVNLKEMFNLPFFPKDDGLRQAIGQEIIDKIVSNTGDSNFLSGSSNKGYSKAYAESDAGVIYGKKAGKKANLSASGDMLASIELNLPSNENKLVIDFSDKLEASKASGHITGDATGVKRDFFGLDQADVNKIAKRFDNAVTDAVALELAKSDTVSQGNQSNIDFVKSLIGGS